ncbi:hypothetical protein BDV24DRAFT_145979 [Aspergillus arachidicola]|uniref:Uncharacterized protein n=1 Tax=Aspergillus arachidicola TaxID=656916 RepID=A0A5N6XM91_9EURO|nr:hypothetical protein BDV24DRAFT_145979 [Aspergillus arachidicola]
MFVCLVQNVNVRFSLGIEGHNYKLSSCRSTGHFSRAFYCTIHLLGTLRCSSCMTFRRNTSLLFSASVLCGSQGLILFQIYNWL